MSPIECRIAEMLTKHRALFWMDTSVKWRPAVSGAPVDQLGRMYAEIRAQSRYDVQLFDFTSHSNFAATHPGMLRYFPTPEAALKGTPMYGTFHTARLSSIVMRVRNCPILP